MRGERKTPGLIDRLVEIWEASVRATHDFLREEDIIRYKPLVWENCESLPVLIHYEGDEAVAFLGIDDTYISMLFVHPDYRGLGIGRDLVDWAVGDYHAETVDVNEQNGQAVGFYLKMGFEVESRSERDGMGMPYPILHLRLKCPGQKMVKVTGNKKEYLSLLLLADPSEEMIDRYLEAGEMFVLKKGEEVIGEAVVDMKGEIKNLAVLPEYQGQLFGMYILSFLARYYRGRFECLWVGTSDYGVGYYERYGFECDHVIRNFFTDNYPEPIIDNGVQCVDMVYLKRTL